MRYSWNKEKEKISRIRTWHFPARKVISHVIKQVLMTTQRYMASNPSNKCFHMSILLELGPYLLACMWQGRGGRHLQDEHNKMKRLKCWMRLQPNSPFYDHNLIWSYDWTNPNSPFLYHNLLVMWPDNAFFIHVITNNGFDNGLCYMQGH